MPDILRVGHARPAAREMQLQCNVLSIIMGMRTPGERDWGFSPRGKGEGGELLCRTTSAEPTLLSWDHSRLLRRPGTILLDHHVQSLGR